MIDLWTLLVVDVFGSFWLAILGITFMMWIIFIIGKVSQVTSFNFISIFILAMALGYSYSFIAIIITLLIIVVHAFAIPRMINS